MTVGHEFIADTFGENAAPRFGFQVDPFGASAAFAALSAKMGFNGHIVARLNYYDKGWMQNNKELEFLWRPDAAMYNAEGLEIFTHIMDEYQYSSPGIPVQEQLKYLCAPPLNRTNCPGGGFLWDGDDGHPSSYWTEQQKKYGFSAYPGVNNSNVRFYADFMVNNTRQRSEWFATDNLLWPFGTDFQHFNASEMMDSMDKVIDYISANNGLGGRYEGITVQYGMLSDYFAAVHKSGRSDGESWRVMSAADGDFLPYNTLNCGGASQDFKETCSGNAGPQFNVSWPQTWSGYYTSHSTLKISERRHSAALRSAQTLVALAPPAGVDNVDAAMLMRRSTPLQHAVGLLPHHDAVAGTMGPGCGNNGGPNCTLGVTMGAPNNAGTVDKDYESRLAAGWQDASSVVEAAVGELLAGHHGKRKFSVDIGEFHAALAAGHPGTVAVQNSLGWQSSRWVRVLLPINWSRERRLTVSIDGRVVPSDVLPAGALACAEPSAAPVECATNPTSLGGTGGMGHDASAEVERDVSRWVLWFRAEIAPLGISTFLVTPSGDVAPPTAGTQDHQDDLVVNGTLKVRNRFFELSFDMNRAILVAVRDLASGVLMPLEQSLQQYTSFHTVENQTSGSSWSLRYLGARSGSYLLHSDAGDPEPLLDSPKGAYPKLWIVRGTGGYVTEVRQRLSPTASQVWRLFNDEDVRAAGFIQLQLGVGPLGGNNELVTHFKTSIRTDSNGDGSEFFTDNNGLLMQQRKFSAYRSFPDGTSTKVAPDPSYSTALNFYPVVRTTFIRDAEQQLTLLVPQSGAVTSRRNGELELMLHRRALQDDAKGACSVFNDTTGEYANIPEDTSEGTTCQSFAWMGTCRADGCPAFSIPMNISTRVEPEIWLLAGGVRSSQHRRHHLAQALNNPPLLLFSGSRHHNRRFAPMGWGALPPSVHLLTLRPSSDSNVSGDLTSPHVPIPAPIGTSTLVLRLQHIDPSSHEAAVVDFRQSGLCGAVGSDSSIEERTLSTLFPLTGPGARPRWKWSTLDNAPPREPLLEFPPPANTPCLDTRVRIAPGDIRTFKVTLKGVNAGRSTLATLI
jgi:hypothetical protein